MCLSRVLAVVVVLLGVDAVAQSAFLGCRDARGQIVQTHQDSTINDVAIATVDGSGQAIILINPPVAARLSNRMKRWIFLHECGHHARGHILRGMMTGAMRGSVEQEQDADCFATEQMMKIDGLSESDLFDIQRSLAATAPGDATHLPGIHRALNLRYCLQFAGQGGVITSGDPAPTSRCRTVTQFEQRVVMQPREVMQPGPCQHCGRNMYGAYGCMHQADAYPQVIPVPTTQVVPVERLVCD